MRTVDPLFGGLVNHRRTWRYFVLPPPRTMRSVRPTSERFLMCAQRVSRTSGGSSALSVA